jgi:hypothetical protein
VQDRFDSWAIPAQVCSMSLPAAYLSQNLTQPLPSKDGGVLRTIGEAVTYMLALPPARGERCQRWRQATKLILTQADHLEGIVSKRLGSRYRSGKSPDGLAQVQEPGGACGEAGSGEDWGRP